MSDEGLPLPPLPRPKAPAIERGPDLERGLVEREMKEIVASQDPNVGRLALAATTQASGKPTFQPFKSGADGLKPLASTLDKTLDSASPEIALARFLGTSVANPFTSAVDGYQVAKIREMQQQFYDKHAPILKLLSENLSQAKAAMRRLGEWLSRQHIPDNGIRSIMDKKAATGNETMRRLNDALGAAETPEDRAKLQAMKADFENWSKERDERLKPEWQEESQLENRINKLNREIQQVQSSSLQDAGMSEGPRTETGAGRVISSTHQQPQSLTHVKSLRDMLLGDRLRLVSIMRQGS